jgi:hypothetical protein
MVRTAMILALPLLVLLFATAPEVGSQGAGSDAGALLVSYEDCRRLTRYVPADDAEYRPGVDVYGRPVASADLDGGSAVELPRAFTFFLDFSPFEKGVEEIEVGQGAKARLEETTLALGRVSVDEDGFTTFDGRPLHDADEARLFGLCREALAARPK